MSSVNVYCDMASRAVEHTETHPTGLFDITAERVGQLTAAEFKELVDNGITKMTWEGEFPHRSLVGSAMKQEHCKILLDRFSGAFGLKIDEASWLRRNENAGDVLEFSFNADSKYGLLIVDGQGVWIVHGNKYRWREMLRLDLYVCVNENQVLKLESLK